MKKLNPDEKIIGIDGLTVGDFWSWAFSDLMVNTIRPIFAEFLVACVLGLTEQVRLEWDAVDLRYRGKQIEVKSSAYVQSWQQRKLSPIIFDITIRKRSWDAATNIVTEIASRSADCYVFCLYAETDAQKVNVLDVSHWHFFVVPTETLNRVLGSQKSVGLSGIQRLCEAVNYHELKGMIDQVLGIEM
jgi:hypothetical protein